MKILIDECLPRKLKSELSEHDCSTVPEMGWAGKKNGELLRLMSGTVNVFITVDQNLKHQQNLATSSISTSPIWMTAQARDDEQRVIRLAGPDPCWRS